MGLNYKGIKQKLYSIIEFYRFWRTVNQTNITEVPNDFLLSNPNTTLDKYKEYLGLSFILFLIFTCFEILIFTLALIETTNKTNKNRTLYMILVGCFSFNIFYMIGGISEYKYKEIA